MQEARNHHFVPKLLLRPWLIEEQAQQFKLWGYYWDDRRRDIACKRRGMDSFCSELDLLSLRAHNLGRDAIERIFFGEIDTKGAIARDMLLAVGPSKLTEEHRVNFARLLLSLEARRPSLVRRIRREGVQRFSFGLNSDPEILEAFAKHGIDETPSEFYEKTTGIALEDRALEIVQNLTDNKVVGEKLINASWQLVQLGHVDGSFILADRPLIRIGGFDAPSALWVLPLSPKTAFLAANRPETLRQVLDRSNFQFCRQTNISSALQAERYVFSVEPADAKWLGRYLGPRKGR